MMRRLLVALAVAMSFPLSVSAAASASVSGMSCSGNLSLSLLDAASFFCSGSFSLSGGTIFSESRVDIGASGSLWLDNLSITAPFVQIVSTDRGVHIGEGTTINGRATFTDAAGGVLTLLPGRDIALSRPGTPASGSISIAGTPASGSISIVGYSREDRSAAMISRSGGDIQLATPGTISSQASPFEAGAIGIVSTVPEPESCAMLLAGLGLLSLAARRSDRLRPSAAGWCPGATA